MQLRAIIRPVLRSVGIVLTLAAAVVLASGCGTASITKRQAVAYANDINLRASDVPRTPPRVVRATPEVQEETVSRSLDVLGTLTLEYLPCRHRPKPVAQLDSQELSVGAGGSNVESSVDVMSNSAGASRDYADCLRPAHAERRKGVARLLVLPTSRGFADHTVMNLPTSGHKTRIYSDVVGFVYGPAEVTLRATGVGAPLPKPTEQRLLSLLYSRAEAHKL